MKAALYTLALSGLASALPAIQQRNANVSQWIFDPQLSTVLY